MARTTLTPLGISALALLEERPMHPYEMYQLMIQRVEDRIVKVRPGSLYHTVDRLSAAGLVREIGTDREGNRPERTTYEITRAGKLALSQRLAEMLGTPAEEYPEFPLAISQAHNLSKDTVLELLRARLGRLRADLEFYAAGVVSVEERNLDRKYWLDITYLRAMRQAEIEWIENVVAELDAGTLEWDAPCRWPSADLKRKDQEDI